MEIGRDRIAVLCTLTLVLLTALGCAGLEPIEALELENLPEVHDQWYVLRNTGDGERIGARHLQVRSDETVLAIVEKIAVQQGRDTVAYRSEVRYAREEPIVPRTATVTTYLNGQPFMGGRASYQNRTLRVSAALTGEEGELREPLRNAQYQTQDTDPVVFLPGLPYLLKEMHETGQVPQRLSLVEFPADLDMLVQLRPGKVLRSPAAPGATSYTVRDPNSEELIARWTLDADGRVKDGLLFQTEFVPSSRAEALGTATVE
jgi:hypothetical protein